MFLQLGWKMLTNESFPSSKNFPSSIVLSTVGRLREHRDTVHSANMDFQYKNKIYIAKIVSAL